MGVRFEGALTSKVSTVSVDNTLDNLFTLLSSAERQCVLMDWSNFNQYLIYHINQWFAVYLSGMLCDICHKRCKLQSSADGVHKKFAGATTDRRSRISLSALFFKKIGVSAPLWPSIATAGVAGLFDFHFGQFWEAGLQSLPDPVCEVFTGGIL